MRRLPWSRLVLDEGRIIGGDFRIVRPLGEGGMGEVFVVDQLSTGRQRALKVMHDRLRKDAKLRARFAREARVASMIDSVHVADVIAAGVEDDSGIPWMAMELLEGRDLQQWVRERGPLSLDEALPVLRQIGHAVGAAHAAGIVHRDLKPQNVFMARSRDARDAPIVKVLDFGLAKLLAQSRTAATSAMGSPGWMPPEQTDPLAPIGPQADVWSLGLVTFFLLTGKPFWRAQHNEEASLEALMKEMLLDPIPAASERAADLEPGVVLDPGLDGWFGRCLHRSTSARFADASEAFEAFERFVLHGELTPPVDMAATVRDGGGADEPMTAAPVSEDAPSVETKDAASERTRVSGDGHTELAVDGGTLASAELGATRPLGRSSWRVLVGVGLAVLATSAVGWRILDSGQPIRAERMVVVPVAPTIGDTAASVSPSASSVAAPTVSAVASGPPISSPAASSAAPAAASASGATSGAATGVAASATVAPAVWRKGAEVRLAYAGIEAKKRCGRDDVSHISAVVTVAADGHVAAVSVTSIGPPDSKGYVADCVRSVLLPLTFEPPGSPQTLGKAIK